tara:strand:+ start:3434 stop:3577 length:144 start_codon:yes stop_codon:yes gene_type:complete
MKNHPQLFNAGKITCITDYARKYIDILSYMPCKFIDNTHLIPTRIND